ncbi:MAG: hypothetical protein AAGH88_09055 [Planctomycetota bacterium]
MSTSSICMLASRLPDARASRNRLLAAAGGGHTGGDVGACVRRCFGELLRLLTFSPGSRLRTPGPESGLRVRYVAEKPSHGKLTDETHLRIEIHAWSDETSCLDALAACIRSGPLPQLYGLDPADPCVPDRVSRSGAVWDITRNEYAVAGTLAAGDNPLASPHYYLCHPFVPCPDARGDRIDRALFNARDTVVIDLAATPTDMARYRDASIRDLGRLQRINRYFDPPGARDDPLAWLGAPPGVSNGNILGAPTGNDPANQLATVPGVFSRALHAPDAVRPPRLLHRPTHRPDRSSRVVEPMRRPDPVVDELLRVRRRFHESLLRPHLTFHARVISRHPADACAVAAALAEESFEDGSYRLVPSQSDATCSELSAARRDVVKVHPLPGEARLSELGDHPLAGLGVVATAAELQSLFALPVAGGRPTHGLARDTDPPGWRLDDLIVLGDEAR